MRSSPHRDAGGVAGGDRVRRGGPRRRGARARASASPRGARGRPAAGAARPRPGRPAPSRGSMWRKSRGQRLARELGDRAGELDAGRPAADDHEGQQRCALGRVGRALGLLERQQDAAADVDRVLDRLQARRERLPLVVAEIGVARAGGDDQVVVGDRAARRAGPRGAAVSMPVTRPSSTVGVALARRMRADRLAMSAGDRAAVATW